MNMDARSAIDALPAASRRSISWSESIVSGLVGAADAAVLVLVGLFYYLVFPGWSYATYQTYLTEIAINVGLTLSVFHYAGLYDCNTIVSWPNRMRQMVLLSALVTLILLTLALAFRISDQFSQLWFFASFLTSSVLIFTLRGGAKMLIRQLASAGVLVRNVAIVGASGQAQHLVSRLRLEDAPWKRVVGIFDDRRTRISREVSGYPVLGSLDDLVRYVRSGKVHDVVITLPWSADDRLVSIIGKLRALPVHIYLGSDLIGYHFPRHREQMLEGVPVLEIASAPLTGWSGLIKIVEDRAVALGTITLLSPLLLLIAVAIRLNSPGPILFRQKLRSRQPRRSSSTSSARCITSGRARKVSGRQPRTTPALPPSAASCAPPASTSCRNYSTSSRATCRWSARGRMPSSTTSSTHSSSAATTDATRSSRESPGGRRSTASAARPTPSTRCAPASSTTSSTSRTGRCGSISRS
ncbi:MAG: hypothetical protein U1E43_08700 [Rhodospirillales bacterium]